MPRTTPHIPSRFQRAITRLRHKRGHGVHSPYIYNIVRNVLMGRGRQTAKGSTLYAKLLEMGMPRGTAAEIERLRHHCGFSRCGVDSVAGNDLVICSTAADIDKIAQQATTCGTTVVILSPHLDTAREEICERIIARHHSTTILRKRYLVIFNNHLPKQHFIL